MSRRREVNTRLRKLEEIGEIMRSMKNLALMETHKLGHYARAQREAVRVIEAVGGDFLRFYPQPRPSSQGQWPLLLAIGTERGFCGEFNEAIWQRLSRERQPDQPIVAVGGRLCARLQHGGLEPVGVEGTTIAEDLPDTLARLARTLLDLQRRQPGLRVDAVHHRSGNEGPVRKSLLDLGTQPLPPSAPNLPPLLYLPPEQFYDELLEHYLLAALQEILLQSLLAENEQRVRHLEGALQRLEDRTEELGRRSRFLRQEEITEEIEIILLSTEGLLDGNGPATAG